MRLHDTTLADERDPRQLYLSTRYARENIVKGSPFRFSLTSRGFYSEVNNVLNAIAYGLVKNRRLLVDETRFGDGLLSWSDFFKNPLPSNPTKLNHPIPWKWEVSHCLTPGFMRIQARVKAWHKYHRPFCMQKFGFYRNYFSLKRQLAGYFCRPSMAISNPMLEHGPYAAIHVRRGDKTEGYVSHGKFIIESEIAPLQDYLNLVRKASSGVRRVFVMTDDFSVFAQLKDLFPELEFETLSQDNETGYRQTHFDSLSCDARRASIRRLIAEVHIAAASKVFVGSFQSNVSRYVALVHHSPGCCYGADSLRRWHPA